MLSKIQNIINELQNTNSQNDKLSILKKYNSDEEVKKFFRYCYDGNLLFGVTSANLKKNQNLSEFEIFEDIFELCDMLIDRVATGNRALALVNGFINGNSEYEELLYNFFDKNLKIGINITQINKALGNIIPVFDVALAATYDKARHDRYGLDNYFIQQKMNGLRMITTIKYNDGNPIITFQSRKGKPFTTMAKVEAELKTIYNSSLYKGVDIVLDGEICVINPDGKEDWNRAVSEAKRKNHTIYNPMYVCFDILTLDEFYGFKQSMNYGTRYTNLKKFLSQGTRLNHLKIVFSVPYSQEHFDKLSEEFVTSNRWEGFIYRINKPYKPGRSTDLLKYKLFMDAEFEVLGIQESVKPMLNESTGLMEDTKCVGSLIIEYKGNQVNVGSGLDDKQRIDWYNNPNLIIGKQIQVKYKEESKNADGTVSLQFPILKYVFEEERDF